MIVFLVSGLWHGASLSFVAWGGLNGLYQVIGDLLKPLRDRLVTAFGLDRNALSHRIFRILVTFVLVDFSWIFFRAGSLSLAFSMIRSMLTTRNPWVLLDGSLYECGLDAKNFTLMLLCIGLLFLADLAKHRGIVLRQVILKQETWFRCLFVALAVTGILIFGIWGTTYDAASFIYFQF